MNLHYLVVQTVPASKSAESGEKKAASAAAHVHYPAGERDEHGERGEHGERDEHDGLSEHPPAAMMLLVLGTLLCPTYKTPRLAPLLTLLAVEVK